MWKFVYKKHGIPWAVHELTALQIKYLILHEILDYEEVNNVPANINALGDPEFDKKLKEAEERGILRQKEMEAQIPHKPADVSATMSELRSIRRRPMSEQDASQYHVDEVIKQIGYANKQSN